MFHATFSCYNKVPTTEYFIERLTILRSGGPRVWHLTPTHSGEDICSYFTIRKRALWQDCLQEGVNSWCITGRGQAHFFVTTHSGRNEPILASQHGPSPKVMSQWLHYLLLAPTFLKALLLQHHCSGD